MIRNTQTRRAFSPGSVHLAALVLAALTLCAALFTRPAQAAEWMQPYLEQVQEWGVMRGDGSGNLNEDRAITRAEFVTLVNRAFGYTEVGPNTFTDVSPNDWYAEDISIAHQAGYFNGTSANTASPLSLVTREQAAVLLGRCLRLQGTTGAAGSSFTDVYDIGGWSRGLVQEAADLGIIQGYADGSFRPSLPITRGQMACFLVRALGTLIQEPGEQSSGGVYGNLTITVPGVKLKDTTITGNLYLTGGVGLGNVELENVNVLGKIVICGSGEAEHGDHSVILRNVTAGSLEVDSLADQFLSIQAEGLTDIGTTTVRTSAYLEDLTENGLGFQTIQLDGAEGATFQLAGNIKEVVNLTPSSSLQLAQGVAAVVTMDEKAAGATLLIDNKASIQELNLDTATPVTGAGSISHLNVNAAGSNVSMLPDTIYVRPGITSSIYSTNMDNIAAAESSEDPRLLAGYPKVKNIATTSADAVFSTNKTGTVYWAVTALMDGSVGEEELMNPSSYPKILRSGTVNVNASNTEFTTKLTGLTKEGSYYVSALLVDARGRRSPVKVAAFTTPDDSAPNFASGYPQNPIITLDADSEQVVQIMVMPTKDCQMYYVLLPKGSTAPTASDFRSAALPGNLGYGVVDLRKNAPFLVSRINTSHLQEKTEYDLYLWLNDADNGKSSAVKKITVTTRDITPPTIQHLDVTNIAPTSVTLTFSLDEPGTLSWVVVKQGDAFFTGGIDKENPGELGQIQIENAIVTGKVIRKGGPVRAATAGVDYPFTVTGLEGQTAYDLYYMAKDTAGNYCVYTKTIEFPKPIKTQDNEPPKAELDFSRFNESSNGVINPWVDSDISIVFDEVAQGTYKEGTNDLYDEFYSLYTKVETSSGGAKEQAKNDLAAALRRYITLYPGTPPTTGRPRTDPVTDNNGTLTDDQLEELTAWIDYREAKVTQVNAQTTITFPGTTGHKLQSGGTYYFMLQDIEDTSGNRIKPNPTYLGSFTTAYATIYVTNNQNEETVTIGGETKPAKIFYLTPEGTEAVPRDTRWDMLIWTDASMKYDLLVRERGTTVWTTLGTANPNLSGSGVSKVYNSLNGNFNSELIRTGMFGTVQEGQGRPYLNEFTGELEFAIVPAETTLNQAVHMEVQIFAGTNTELSNISRVQGTEATLSERDITAIGEPDPFRITISPPDSAPTVRIPVQGIIPGDIATTVHVNVDRYGTVYYFAVPLGNVDNDHLTGTGYTMFETYPAKASNNQRPDLSEIPTSWDDNEPLWLASDAPDPDDIIQDRRQSPLTTIWGSTGNDLKSSYGTTLNIQGLTAETTYLLYLATVSTEGTTAENVLCYMFTTTPPEAPKITITPGGSTRTNIEVSKASDVDYILVLSSQVQDSSNPFSQPFSNYLEAGITLPTEYAGYTVLDAMLNAYYVGRDYMGSVFDNFASTSAKQTYADYIRQPNNVFVNPAPAMNRSVSIATQTGQFDLTGMDGRNYYTLIVVARGQNSISDGFRASQSYYSVVRDFLYLLNGGLSDNSSDTPSMTFTGTLQLTFSDSLYYNVQSGNDEKPYPVDSCQLSHSLHMGAANLGGNDHVNIGSFMFPSSWANISLTNPALNTNNSVHGTTVGPVLVFDVRNATAGMSISFTAGLCGSNGAVRGNTTNAALNVILRKSGTAENTQWYLEWGDAWNRATE